ncbi:Nicotinate-nucleotide--dimethylbenzimidazole phosphoribosyltransferase [Rhodovastum atsumiense]|uniref:Nicotinate-nucleotide--dimethylbenzimidazole phosphoribosyltransferase n=1 Tax=Rhodovastum atsumiense TaxID=504468 RepID=A0A5M6IQT4_9PROT|nr:nicotinate-nucleotide--dimethylbenzimidazole phosphoribosyltransferase [Rhodovastum atsumiense]KAA5610636.1 nicotinate-nucleotide--dimethylbenzimidazole phosphoribosyltransferase [Rhodovastum atsumiense]CAH2600761.1 Nicotinate-nucleotide--dimethylbenzimidazole phosphoribosyltransferase [Rhodovastum atsumiense]
MSHPASWQAPAIPPLAHDLTTALQARIDAKTKPPGSLGRLEDLALRLGLMQGTTRPVLTAPAVLVFAGDHGFARDGVSPFPPEVTPQMVANFLAGGAGINVFARLAGLPVKVIDAGVAVDLPPHPDLIDLKVRHGTRNALQETALTPDEVALCLDRGGQVVADLAARGCNAILPGEMGIGNSSAAALITSALLDIPLADCVGIGAGHDPAGHARKREILARVQARHPGVRDPLEALAAFGGCEIAMMAGAMLAAASRRMLVLVDGIIATSAALVAARLAPAMLDYAVFAHVSGDGPHRLAVEALGGRPLLDLGLRLGEGTGAALAWPLVRAAAGFLEEMATFEAAGVSERTGVAPQP